jgi:putative membrane protein
MKKILILLLIAGSGLNTVKAQTPDPDTTARHFIIMASIGNLQEINAGKLAAQKAVRPDVKSFGQLMVADHSNTEQKLMQLAKSRGFQIPVEATGTPPPDLNLAKVSGDNFDRLYIHNMVSGHRNTVAMFRNYALTGKNPDDKAFAQQTLPTLEEHLAAITAIDKKYKYLAAK